MADANILFVCTGNTCRSPMAEGLFSKAAAEMGYQVSSAGVAAYQGAPASPETVDILREKGIVLENFGSRMVSEEILTEVSHVFCLTSGHLELLREHFPAMEEKFYLVTEFAEIDGKVGRDVSDPIGCGKAAYQEVAAQLETSITGILGFLKVGK